MATGSCLCGNITYQYEGEAALTALCHCIDCQAWTGASGSSNVAVPTKAFHILKGTPKKFDRNGASGKGHPQFFCGDCGSSLYSDMAALPDTILIKSGTLNGKAKDIPIAIEFFVKDRPAYCQAVPGAKQAQTME